MLAPWIRRDRTALDFAEMHQRDSRGDRIHLILALWWGVSLAFPRVFLEMAIVPASVCWVARLWYIHRAARWPFAFPLGWALLVYTGWVAVSLWWTPDVRAGLRELSYLRHALPLLVLWPVVEHRAKAIVAITVGFLVGVAVQLSVALGERWGVPWLVWEASNKGRVGGWWHPMQGGQMLAAALALHAPVVFRGRGRVLWYAIPASALTLAGVLLTGTRAAMLASALLLSGMVAWSVVTRSTRQRGVLVAAVLLAVAGVLAATPLGALVAQRARAVTTEITQAVREGDYESDNGIRVRFLEWGWRQWAERPIAGWGAGSCRLWIRDHVAPEEGGRLRESLLVQTHVHPHNTILHMGATLGVVGVGLWVLVVGLALAGAWANARGRWGTYDAGPFFALLVFLALIPFDSLMGSSRTNALFLSVAAWCAPVGAAEISGRKRA